MYGERCIYKKGEGVMKSINKRIMMLFMIFCLVVLFPCAVNATNVPNIKYQAHISKTGWLSTVGNGRTAGTTGKSTKMEALKIVLTSNKKSMIKYRAHVAGIGWQDWRTSGKIAGTTGQSRAIEAVQIKLTNTYEKKYDVYYRVHVAHKGWLGWAKNGATAGSTGLGLRTEAIQIKLVKKKSKISTGGKAVLERPTLSYKGHVQSAGWQKAVSEGKTAGTTGKRYRLEALQIYLKDFDGKNGISYRTHVAHIGWQNWVASGRIAGTTGKAYAIEAIQIKLSNTLSSYFDIYYRVHSADYGWLGWTKNGEIAGTTGGGIQAEAIQIKLVNKGASIECGGTAYYDLSGIQGIILKHYMLSSLKQGDYPAFNSPYGYNAGCCAMVYATGLSIVNKCHYNPTRYWYVTAK